MRNTFRTVATAGAPGPTPRRYLAGTEPRPIAATAWRGHAATEARLPGIASPAFGMGMGCSNRSGRSIGLLQQMNVVPQLALGDLLSRFAPGYVINARTNAEALDRSPIR